MIERGLRAKCNFIDDWIEHEKEMNIRGFMGEFDVREKYEEAKRKALGLEEDIENDEDTVERLSKINEEYIVNKETLREAMKKAK
jgi:hypothetical protein